MKWAGIGGWLKQRVVLVCVGGYAGPSGCVPVLTQGFICRVRDSGGKAFLPDGGELRFAKTLHSGDIGV